MMNGCFGLVSAPPSVAEADATSGLVGRGPQKSAVGSSMSAGTPRSNVSRVTAASEMGSSSMEMGSHALERTIWLEARKASIFQYTRRACLSSNSTSVLLRTLFAATGSGAAGSCGGGGVAEEAMTAGAGGGEERREACGPRPSAQEESSSPILEMTGVMRQEKKEFKL